MSPAIPSSILLSLLKNSFEEIIREKKVPLLSVADAQPELTKKRYRESHKQAEESHKERDRVESSREEERHRLARDRAKTRGTLKTGSRAGYFLRDVAYFYRFYIFYVKYHPLLCLAEASRLGHPLRNSLYASARFSFPW